MTTRPESKSPAAVEMRKGAAAGAKEGEHRRTPGAVTPPAPGGNHTPTARLVLPPGAPEDQWHAVRRTGVGGSDVAAILGLDRFRGPLHVWHDKMGTRPPVHDARLERAARRGHRLEGLVADEFALDSGHTVLPAPGTLQHVDHPHWLANPDRLVDDGHGPHDVAVLECKSRTYRSGAAEGWRGDESPDGVALQVAWYLTVSGYQRAYAAALVDDDLVWYRLERDDELCDMLARAVDQFWHEHVLAQVPPPADGNAATTELLTQLWNVQPEATVEIDPVQAVLLTQRRRELREQIAELDGELATVENRMRALAGENEVATVGHRPLYTWRRNGQFATARFRVAEPELAARYTRMVPAVDTERLAADHPHTYSAYRARVLRVPSEG